MSNNIKHYYDCLEDPGLFKNGGNFHAKVDRTYFLGKSGEYGTVMKLLRFGIDAHLTEGNRKGFDVVAFSARFNRYAKIEVKTSNKAKFVTGFFQKYGLNNNRCPDYWVFVYSTSVANCNYCERYFVLSNEEMQKAQWEFINDHYFVKKGITMSMDQFAKEEQRKKSAGKQGLDTLPLERIINYEDEFYKIYNFLNV